MDTLEVMHFNLRNKDGVVYVGDKPKASGDDALKKKFGEGYGAVKKTFDEGLQNWKGKEEELNAAAFGMYEKFRPSVKAGEKGWGRKGELDLEKIREIVTKGS